MAWRRGAASAGSLGGVTAGTAAGLVWGLAFLVPVLLHGWSAVAVTSGRYLAYGAVSAILFALGGRSLRGLTRRHWRPALAFAITGNVGYYLLLVLGIELIGAPVTDIVIGCIPVTLALAGNIASRAYAWRKLALPVGLVTAGLLFANIPAVAASPGSGSVTGKVLGLLAAFGAVALWTWYGLANARFLSRNPEVPNASWSTLVGLFTGAITLIGLPLAVVTHQIGRPSDVRSVTWLVGGSLVLGVIVSWGGTFLWNLASARLSTVSAGMLVNVETVAGYAYVYAARAQWPPPGQLLGFALIVIGVLIVVRRPAAQRGSTPPMAAATWRGWRIQRHRQRTLTQPRRAAQPDAPPAHPAASPPPPAEISVHTRSNSPTEPKAPRAASAAAVATAALRPNSASRNPISTESPSQ